MWFTSLKSNIFYNFYKPKSIPKEQKVEGSRMSTAPFFFLLASLLIMVRDGEVRFLLVKLGDGEGVAKEFSRAEGN